MIAVRNRPAVELCYFFDDGKAEPAAMRNRAGPGKAKEKLVGAQWAGSAAVGNT